MEKLTENQDEAWLEGERWRGVERPYERSEVERLQGSLRIEYTLATSGSKKLWTLLNNSKGSHIAALGALTGNQAVQMVKAGLKAIYVSGWQVAADANLSGNT